MWPPPIEPPTLPLPLLQLRLPLPKLLLRLTIIPLLLRWDASTPIAILLLRGGHTPSSAIKALLPLLGRRSAIESNPNLLRGLHADAHMLLLLLLLLLLRVTPPVEGLLPLLQLLPLW